MEGNSGLEVTVAGRDGSSVVKEIFLLGHCAFCLRRTSKTGGEENGGLSRKAKRGLPEGSVPEADFLASFGPSFLVSLNWTWSALRRKRKDEENGGDEKEDVFGVSEREAWKKAGLHCVTKFNSIPTLCQDCGNKVLEVDKLLNLVMEEIASLRESLGNYKGFGCPDGNFRDRLHNSGLDNRGIQDTWEFLEDFRNRVGLVAASGERQEVKTDITSESMDVEDDNRALPDCDSESQDTAGSSSPADYIDKSSKSPSSIKQEEEGDYLSCNTHEYDFVHGKQISKNLMVLPTEPIIGLETMLKSCNTVQENLDDDFDESDPPFSTPENSDSDTESECEEEEEEDSIPAIKKKLQQKKKIVSGTKASAHVAPRLTTQLPLGPTSVVMRDDTRKILHLTSTNSKTPTDYFICLFQQCGTRFEGPDGMKLLESHLTQDHGWGQTNSYRKKVKCDRCEKIMDSDYLPKHQRLFCSSTNDKVRCDICGKLTSPEWLPIHTETCKKKQAEMACKVGTLKCEYCNVFFTKSSLERHRKRVHPEVGSHRKIMCDLCKVQLLPSGIVEHLKGHLGNSEEYVIRCPNPKCTFACITTNRMLTHLATYLDIDKKSCLKKSEECQPDFVKSIRRCAECNSDFKNLQQLRGHLFRNHETTEKNFPCPVSDCQKKFSVRQSVVLHLGEHDVPRETDAQICCLCVKRGKGSKKRIKLEDMESHLKQEHGAKEVVKCKKCSFWFPSWEELVNHMFEHRYGELLCDICGDTGEKFNRHRDLQEHYFKMHQVGKQYQCKQCPRSFFKPESLNTHIRIDHKKVQDEKLVLMATPAYQCEDCGAVYKNEDSLRSHKIREHGAEPYSCTICSQTFSNRSALVEHEKVVHRGIAKLEEFPCSEPNCGQVFQNHKRYRCHRKAVHSTKKFVCEQCGKKYKTAADLKHHSEVTHLGIRKWICNTCGEAFTSSTTLKKHNLIHTGERPFACDICGQRFRHKEVLSTHVKGHLEKGADFKPNGPMKQIRKRVKRH